MVEVSIVIPTYNSSPFIMATLQSVQRAARHFSHEIILVDDRSPDIDRLREVTRDVAGLRIIEKPHKCNAAGSRNLGIAAAQGRFIFLLDSDDAFMPEHIERRVRLHQQQRCAIIFGNYLARNSYRTFKVSLAPYDGDMYDYLFRSHGDVRSSTLSIFRPEYRSTTFDALQNKHQDWGFALRASRAGESLAFDEHYGVVIDTAVNSGRMSNVLNIPASTYFIETYVREPEHLRGFALNHLRVVLKNNDKQSTHFIRSLLARSLSKASLPERLKYLPVLIITANTLTRPVSLMMRFLAASRALTVKSGRKIAAPSTSSGV